MHWSWPVGPRPPARPPAGGMRYGSGSGYCLLAVLLATGYWLLVLVLVLVLVCVCATGRGWQGLLAVDIFMYGSL
jgi:hypothetical protein